MSEVSDRILKDAVAAPSPVPARPLRWLMRALALVALGLSGYLAYTTPVGSPPPAGCGPGSGCGEVLASPWSNWLGIAVVYPAMAVYAGMLVLLFYLEPDAVPARRRRAWLGLVLLATMAAGAALWFIFAQAVLIEAYCIYCSVIHGVALALAALIFLLVPIARPLPPGPQAAAVEADDAARGGAQEPDQAPTDAPAAGAGIRPRPLMGMALLGLLAVGVLIGGQVAFKPPTHRILPYAINDDQQWEIPLHEFPRLGPLDAPQVLVFFTDYTCPHCRDLHHSLHSAQQRYGEQIAIAIAHAPLSLRCNPHYGVDSPTFAEGCAYARLAMAVWLSNPEAFEPFDAFLAEGDSPPALDAAEQRAYDAAGRARVRAALESPRLEQMLEHGIRLNQAIRGHQRARGEMVDDGVPTLLLGEHGVLVGTPAGGTEELLRILEQHLPIEPQRW